MWDGAEKILTHGGPLRLQGKKTSYTDVKIMLALLIDLKQNL